MRSPKLVLATSNEDMHDQPNLDSSMPTPSNGFGYKNLGRKKSNPAWAFFIDLRDQGLPGIKCRHCDFVSDDRSPLTMKYHIKKLHNTGVGGLWSLLEEQYRLQAEGKPIADLSTSFISNTSIGQSSTPEYTRTRNTRHSLTSNTPEQTASKKGLKKLSKEDPNDDLVDEAPILSQEIDQDPSSSSIKTEEKEQTYSFPLKLEKAVAPPLLDYVEPHRPRNSNLWIHLGRFDTEEEMHAVRSKQKVSKRRAEVMKHGTKIRYRCNRWKRTKCAYQMYAYFADSKIDLYESGEHDHSGEKLAQHLMRMQNKGETGGVASTSCSTSQSIVAKQFKLSQEDILNNLLRQATNKQEIVTVNSNSQNYVEHEDGMTPKLLIQESNPTAQLLNMANAQFDLQQEAERLAAAAAQSLTPHTSSPCLTNGVGTKRKASQVPDKFIWSDESSKSQLMELASELDMIASFGEKRSEFTFTCKASTHKSVRFIDQGECVQVENMHNQSVKEKEVWTKGDWSQFLWAVRGKCVHYLLLIHSSTPNNSGINGVVAPWHKGDLQKFGRTLRLRMCFGALMTNTCKYVPTLKRTRGQSFLWQYVDRLSMGGMRCKVCQKGSKNAIIFACGVAEIKSHLLIFHKDVHQLVCRTNQLDDSNNETPAKVPCPNAEQSRTVKQLTCCSSRSSRKLKRKHSNLSQDYNTCQTTTPSRPYNLRSQSAKRLNCSREESCSMQQVPVDQCYVAPDVVVNSTSRKPSASTRNKTPVKNLKETVKNLTQSSRANCSNSVCSTATHRSKQKINCLPISQLNYDWIQVADCELESDIHLLLKAHDMVKIDNQRECHSNLARPTFYNCLFEKTKGCRFQMYLCYENGRWKLFRKKGLPWHRHACDKQQPRIDPQASQLVPYSKPKKKLPRLDLEIVEDEIAPSAATSTTTCLTHLKSSINSSAAAARHPTRTARESGTTDATPPEIYKRRTNTNYTLLATFDNPQEFKSYRERKSKGLNLWSLKNNDKLANGCTRTRFRCYSYRFTKCRCCLVAATAPNTDTIWVYRNSADHNHMVDNGLGVDISSTSHGATTSATDPIVTYNQLISVPAQFVSQHIKMPIPGFDLMDETLSQRIQNLAEDLILKLDIVGTNFYFYHGFNPEACVALEDFYLGGVVMVQTREHNGVVSEERWIKGDFDQFLCAVRGKCMEVFFQTERRERHTPDSEDTPMPVIEIGDEEEESDTQEGPFTLTNGTRNEVFSMAAYNMLLQFANLDRGIQFLRDQQIQFPAEELQFLDEPSNSVQVIHIVDGMIASVKRWVKADWSQFVCAVRGICFNHFYASPLESMKREMKLESENQSTEVE